MFIELVRKYSYRGTAVSFNEPTLLLEHSLHVFDLARKEGYYHDASKSLPRIFYDGILYYEDPFTISSRASLLVITMPWRSRLIAPFSSMILSDLLTTSRVVPTMAAISRCVSRSSAFVSSAARLRSIFANLPVTWVKDKSSTSDESRRTHVYTAALPQEKTQRRLVRDLLDRAFSGSARTLVVSALSAQELSAEELAQIRQLLDQLEEGKSDDRRGD